MKITQAEVTNVRAKITATSREFVGLCGQRGRSELADDLPPLVERMNRGVFRLVVMGEIKKGKSSFINALLGMGALLPTDIDIATSTVYKIIYGPEKKIKVFFLADPETGRVSDPLVIPESQIAEYGTEAGNPGNGKKVDFIAVEHPAELLKSGLVIVDTPGVGGLFKAHRGITWQYAPNADAIFFVLDSTESVISADEIKFLEELIGKITDRVYFVQTKTDMAGKEQWQAWHDRNRKLLMEKLPKLSQENLRYFPISSKLKREGDKLKIAKLVADSGYPAVEAFLRDELVATKDWLLCQETAKVFASKAALLHKETDSQLRVVQAETREKLDALEKQAQAQRQALADWDRTTFQTTQEAFSDKYKDLRMAAADKLQDILDPQSGEITLLIDELRKQSASAATLNCEIRNFQQKMIAICSENGKQVLDAFNGAVYSQIVELSKTMETHVDANDLVSRMSGGDWGAGVTQQNSLHLTHSGYERARTAAMGGSFAAGIAFVAGNLLFPGLGFLTGALALGAAGAGAYCTDDQLTSRRREEALSKTEKVLRETVAQVRKAALQDFNRLALETERKIRDLFKNAVKATKERYERELAQIQESRSRTQAELKQKAEGCTAVLRQVDTVAGVCQDVLNF